MKVTPSFTSVILSVKFSEPALIYRKPVSLGSQRMVGSIKERQTHISPSQVRTLWAILDWLGGVEAWAIISLTPEMGVLGGEVERALDSRNDWQLPLYPCRNGGGVAEIRHVLQATFCSVLDIKVISILPRAGHKTRTGAHVCQEACECIWEWA